MGWQMLVNASVGAVGGWSWWGLHPPTTLTHTCVQWKPMMDSTLERMWVFIIIIDGLWSFSLDGRSFDH